MCSKWDCWSDKALWTHLHIYTNTHFKYHKHQYHNTLCNVTKVRAQAASALDFGSLQLQWCDLSTWVRRRRRSGWGRWAGSAPSTSCLTPSPGGNQGRSQGEVQHRAPPLPCPQCCCFLANMKLYLIFRRPSSAVFEKNEKKRGNGGAKSDFSKHSKSPAKVLTQRYHSIFFKTF